MKPHPTFKIILFVLTLVALGSLAFKLGENLFAGRELREPAALRRSLMDYSSLPPASFAIKAREHLLQTVRMERKANDLIISAGHFLGPNTSASACTTYKYIDYYLEAEGIAVSGEAPKMRITIPCEPATEYESIEPAHINIVKLVGLEPIDQVIKFDSDVTIETQNFPEEWPNQWILVGMTMRGETDRFVLNDDAIQKIGLAFRSVSW